MNNPITQILCNNLTSKMRLLPPSYPSHSVLWIFLIVNLFIYLSIFYIKMFPPFSASAKKFVLSFSFNYYCCITNNPKLPHETIVYYAQRFCILRICTGHCRDWSTFSGASARKTHTARVTWTVGDWNYLQGSSLTHLIHKLWCLQG